MERGNQNEKRTADLQRHQKARDTANGIIIKAACISDCQRYRYTLTRIWDVNKGHIIYCLLNPSTADAELDDPTIIRCVERAKRMGFGGIEVVNLFAFRSSDPRNLYTAGDPVGPANDEFIRKAAQSRPDNMFLCGWGNHGGLRDRAKEVLYLLKTIRVDPYALKLNRDGHPAHPLYIGYNVYPTKIGEF